MANFIYWQKAHDRIYARDRDTLKYMAVITPVFDIPEDVQAVIDEAGETSITAFIRACYAVYHWQPLNNALISAEEERELDERCRFYTAGRVRRLSAMLDAVGDRLNVALTSVHDRALAYAGECFSSRYISRQALQTNIYSV